MPRPVPQARSKSPKKVAVSTTARTFVLDTSVLLADPGALKRFAEHEVVLPVVVITELEGKRHHPELGFFARTALRMLDALRIKASAVGLDAEDYRGDAISDSDAGYSGMAELDVTAAELDELYDDGSIDLPAAS